MSRDELPNAEPPQILVPAESTSRTWRLARKELREILRDRRTVITLVLMPLLVYPLLGVIMRKGVLSNLSLDNIAVHVCLETEQDSQILTGAMVRGNRLRSARFPEKTPLFQVDADAQSVLPTGGDQQLNYQVYILDGLPESATLEQQVADGFADLAIRVVPDQTRESQNGSRVPFVKWEFIQAENSSLGKRATREITECLEASNDAYLTRLLVQNDLSPDKPAVMKTTILPSQIPDLHR